MGLFGWVAVVVALALVVGVLRAGAQIQPREFKPPVAQAVPPTPTHVPTRTPTPPGHAAYWDTARNATRDGLNTWIGSAEVRGKVKGTAGFVDGEWLLNHVYDIQGSIHGAMRQAGAPEDTAKAVAEELTEAWKTWIRGYKSGNFVAFPGFAAYPGPVAPTMPATVPSYPLRLGVSTRDGALTQELAGRIKARVPNERGADVDQFATWVAERFRAWKADAYLKNLMGSGRVPSFAPPYVPVGPVDGTMTGRVGSPTKF